jgi:hypothetical protein
MALIKLQALMTIRRQRWLTRQVAVENGQVVRTTGADPAPKTAQAPIGAPQGAPVPVGAPTELLSATMPIRPHVPSQGGPRLQQYPVAAAAAGRAGGVVPSQAPPTEQLTQARGRPRPHGVDQPTSPVSAVVPRQATGSGPVPIAPPRGQQADGKPVESQTQQHPAAVARKGVA